MSEEQMTRRIRSKSASTYSLQFETRQYLQALQKDEDALSRAYKLFTYKEKIWPDQCKNVATLLQRIQEPVQSLFILLERPELRSSPIAQHRHLALMTLQHVDEQISELPPLIMRFYTTCRTLTKQTSKQKEEIRRRLELLLQAYNRTLQNVSLLSDILHFRITPPEVFLAEAPDAESERIRG